MDEEVLKQNTRCIEILSKKINELRERIHELQRDVHVLEEVRDAFNVSLE